MSSDLTQTKTETTLFIAGLLVIAALGYTVYPILSPFVLVGALVYLLYPLRDQALVRRVMWLGVALFVLWFFYSILALLAPFLLAFLIAYILNPLVSKLDNHRIPRWVSSLVLTLLLTALVIGALLFVLPIAVGQFQGIIAGVAGIVNDFADLLKSGTVFQVLSAYGLPVEMAQDVIGKQLSPRLESILKTLFEGLLGFVSGFSSLLLHLINAVIIPFIVFYLLKDFPLIRDRFVMMVPTPRRERVVDLGGKIDRLMGKYIRGAIAVAAIQGTIAAVGLWFIDVHYALVLGIMTGILNFVPYIGLLTSLVVSSIVAVFSGGHVLTKVLAVVLLYLAQKLLEATVLAPKIVGGQVGLHPVLLILSLMVFGYFLGFVGLLIAVPVTALILAAVTEWRMARSSSSFQETRGA